MLRVEVVYGGAQTSPGAAVEFDAHADGASIGAVRHQAHLARHDRRTDVAHLRHERVHVARQHLRRRHTGTISIRIIPNC